MELTLEKLKDLNACSEGVKWFERQTIRELKVICQNLINDKRWSWANWLLVRLMTHKQKAQYAVFAAEQVIPLFEMKYPEDQRPREAIGAVKNWIKNPNKRTAAAAADAADAAAHAAHAAAYTAAAAAYTAADAADAADAAAHAAAHAAAYTAAAAAAAAAADAAHTAAHAAYTAADAAAAAAADAADAAAHTAAHAAYTAADAARKNMRIKIVNYGLELLGEQ